MAVVQHGILVLDASRSMEEKVRGAPKGTTKAWQVEEILCKPLSESLSEARDRLAILNSCGMIARLQNSRIAENIDLTIIRYDEDAEVYQQKKNVPISDWELSLLGTKLDPAQKQHYSLGGQPFDLLAEMRGRTNIAKGLDLANQIAQEYISYYEQQPGYDAYVSIVLMSDMQHNEGDVGKALQVAADIKNNTRVLGNRPQTLITCAAFGDDADLERMKKLATEPRYAIKTTNPIELREFFVNSVSGKPPN